MFPKTYFATRYFTPAFFPTGGNAITELIFKVRIENGSLVFEVLPG